MNARACRRCGCTEISACLDADGEPCCWMDDDLCSVCADAIVEEAERDAARYRHLRNRSTTAAAIAAGGVFGGKVPDNTILGGEDLDRAIDAQMGVAMPEIATLESRLATAPCRACPSATSIDWSAKARR